MLDTPKIEMRGTTASFWKLWLSAYTHFQQGGKMTLLQIFPCCEELARWICNKEEIAEGSVLQWQNLLKIGKGMLEPTVLSEALSCMRCSGWSLSVRYLKIDGWQRPDLARTAADPNLVPFRRGCTCIPESRIWPCEWFYPQMQLMRHAQRKGRMQIPCREATASHVNKEAFWVCSSQPTWAAVSMVYQML